MKKNHNTSISRDVENRYRIVRDTHYDFHERKEKRKCQKCYINKGLGFSFQQGCTQTQANLLKKDKSSRIIWMAFLNSMYKKKFLQYVSIDSSTYKRQSNSCRVTSLKNKN